MNLGAPGALERTLHGELVDGLVRGAAWAGSEQAIHGGVVGGPDGDGVTVREVVVGGVSGRVGVFPQHWVPEMILFEVARRLRWRSRWRVVCGVGLVRRVW